MKCSKCNKEIPVGKGLYNRPDGIVCVKCNDKSPYHVQDHVYESLGIIKKCFGL